MFVVSDPDRLKKLRSPINLWQIGFITGYGRKKPDAMYDRPSAGYLIKAAGSYDALKRLEGSSVDDFDAWCCGLYAILNNDDVRVIDFCLERRECYAGETFDNDPNDTFHYAYIIPLSKQKRIEIPTREEAQTARNIQSRKKDPQYQARLPSVESLAKLTPPDDLSHFIRRSNTGCWRWKNKKDTNGYGIVPKSKERAHRLHYQRLVAEIPAKAHLRHLCHFKDCCNPAHLVPGTAYANRADRKVQKEARAILRSTAFDYREKLLKLRTLHGVVI